MLRGHRKESSMHHVVIGGNAAGMSAAAKIRRTAPEDTLTVLEKSSIVSFGGCGLPYYVGDFFSDPRYLLHRSPERFREDGVDLRLNHTVTRVDPVKREVIGVDGHGEQFSLTYDNLIVTSGADSITPPIEGVGLKNIFTLRVLDDGEAIKEAIASTGEHAVVVGGGFIGLEIAEALHRAGKKVRIIELMDRVLKAAVSPEISELAQQEILSQGVELSLEEKVEAFRGDESVRSVVTSKGTYPADLVILSVGVRVQTQFLASSGIDMLPNGAIIVNNKGESSIEHIYAAGDCAAVPEMQGNRHLFSPLATSANKLGRIIGDRIGGSDKVYPGTLATACVKVFTLEIARTGVSEEGESISSVFIKDKNQTAYYPGQEDIYIKLFYSTKTGKITGAQTAGKNGAVLRINPIAMAIQLGGTVEDLALADFCYAPPFAKTWDALNVAGSVASSAFDKKKK